MNRYLPVIVFVVVGAIGLAMTYVVHSAEKAAAESRFEVVADDAADRVRERVSEHIAFLQAAHSFFNAQSGAVSHEAFETFIRGLEISKQFEGIQGIGFARMISTGGEGAIARELARNYGIDRQVWPETDKALRTPIVQLEPADERNMAALGYDMYAEPVRRAAMTSALAAGAPFASAPVELVQEITAQKQAGFLVYIPLDRGLPSNAPEDIEGFVYAPFRAGDLHRVALDGSSPPPVVVETMDITGRIEGLLFKSPDYDAMTPASRYQVERSFPIAGREWRMTIHETPDFAGPSNLGTFALGSISLLLALALAASTRAQAAAVSAARQLHATSEKSLQDREMMLQEMKHRIKNSIARVLAIARQTAAHSETLDEFSTSFMARMQAMAGAQDMLTRSHWQRADLGELLDKEAQQVFGSAENYVLDGPSVELNERATQALGLVFHELATNALKYGGIQEPGGSLTISWQRSKRGRSADLHLDWIETSPNTVTAPENQGFGTKLIDANIKGELGGTIDRAFTETGMRVRIVIPAASYA